MKQGEKHHRIGRPYAMPARWSWIRWPVIVLGGGGTTAAIWGEEALLVECAPLALLPLLAGPLYLFNHLVFKATKPHGESCLCKDNPPTTSKGYGS